MRAFAHLFEAKPSGLNTLNILRSNPHMIELQQSINQAVIDDFAAAKEAVRVSGTHPPGNQALTRIPLAASPMPGL